MHALQRLSFHQSQTGGKTNLETLRNSDLQIGISGVIKNKPRALRGVYFWQNARRPKL